MIDNKNTPWYTMVVKHGTQKRKELDMKNKIKEFRERLKMTQDNLAEKSGLSRPYICDLENGKRMVVKSTTMESIAKALNSSVSEIFFEK